MNEPLDRLIHQIQQAIPGSTERQQLIANLIEQYILPKRPVARTPRGQPLSGIYLETVEAGRADLQSRVDDTINHYQAKRLSAEVWIRDLLNQMLKTVLDESRLQQFAFAVQHCQPQTSERQNAINDLLHAIQYSGKLASGRLARDIDRDVINRTLMWVCQNIDSYQAERGSFINWINYRLNMVAREVQQDTKDSYTQSVQSKVLRTKYQLTSLLRRLHVTDLYHWLSLYLKKLLSNDDLGLLIMGILTTLLAIAQQIYNNPVLESTLLFDIAQASVTLPPKLVQIEETQTVETIAQPETDLSLGDELRRYLVIDPQGLCQKAIRSHPEVTFQKVALARLDGRSWQELSQTFDIKIAALSNFFQRHLQKIAPVIRQAIQDGF